MPVSFQPTPLVSLWLHLILLWCGQASPHVRITQQEWTRPHPPHLRSRAISAGSFENSAPASSPEPPTTTLRASPPTRSLEQPTDTRAFGRRCSLSLLWLPCS